MNINCKKCKAPISNNDKEAYLPFKQEEESLCGDCSNDIGICPVCNEHLYLRGIGDEWICSIVGRVTIIYVHARCNQWLNSLVRKGECDKCHSQDVELAGWNCYGKLCMPCVMTLTILPLSEYKDK